MDLDNLSESDNKAYNRFKNWLELEKSKGLIDLKFSVGQIKPENISQISNSIVDIEASISTIVDIEESHDKGTLVWPSEEGFLKEEIGES